MFAYFRRVDVLACLALAMNLALVPRPAASARYADVHGTSSAVLSNLPLSFAPNAGQFDASVRFQAWSPGGALFFMPDAVVLALHNRAIVRMQFENAHAALEVAGGERLPGIMHVLHGSHPSAWRTGIPTYARLVSHQLYPGIDLRYEGSGGQFKGTYTVAPGTDPSRIRWRYMGVENVRVNANAGDLLVTPATS
jgi:hypothetical protein